MAEPLADRVIKRIGQAAELYHRLVMLVAPAGSGKTAALQDVHERTAAPLVNVNLELSRRMLDLTERQRALQLPRLLAEIVGASAADVVLLDNVEVLFDGQYVTWFFIHQAHLSGLKAKFDPACLISST